MFAEAIDAFGIELDLDIRHRELVIPEGQDALAQSRADLLGWPPAAIGRPEYVCGGIFESTEVADDGIDGSGIDLEAARDLLGGKPLHIEGAHDFVSAMVGMGGAVEKVGGVRAWHGDP